MVWIYFGTKLLNRMSFVSQKLLSGKRRKQFLQMGSDLFGSGKINSSGDVIVTHNNVTNVARVYSWNGSSWTQKGIDIPSSNSITSIDSSGNVISCTDSTTRVYEWNGSSWVQRGSDIAVAGFDASLSSNGNFIIIGNKFFSGNYGVAYVYSWNGSSWVQRGSTFTDTQVGGTLLGSSVSINSNGNVIAIGAPFDGYYTGSITVYYWSGTAWVQRQKLEGVSAYTGYSGDRIGDQSEVAIDSTGDIIAYGIPLRLYDFSVNPEIKNVGVVFSSRFNGTSFLSYGIINDYPKKDYATKANSYYGNSVALSSNGEILAVSSQLDSGYKIDVFRHDINNTWSRFGYITLPDNPSLSFNSSGSILAVGTLNYSRIYRYT